MRERDRSRRTALSVRLHKAVLNLAVARAREVLALMRERAVDRKTGVRRLHAVDLWEISVVTFPMLPQARITAVKDAAGDERRLLRALTEGARLLRS